MRNRRTRWRCSSTAQPVGPTCSKSASPTSTSCCERSGRWPPPDRGAAGEVAAGGWVIGPRIVEGLVRARSRRCDSPLEHLTPREREVLAEMAQGRNNAGIAAALGLSERAVEKHINSLFSKLALSEETDGHRRVKAVLVYLSAHDA